MKMSKTFQKAFLQVSPWTSGPLLYTTVRGERGCASGLGDGIARAWRVRAFLRRSEQLSSSPRCWIT